MTSMPPSPALPFDDAAATPQGPPGISKLWWVLTAVMFVLAFGLGIGGCATLVGQNTQGDESVAVPGEGVVTIEEAGSFRIRYQSDQFIDTGVCHRERRSGSSTGSDLGFTVCDTDQLAAAGEPTLRPPGGGDRLRLTRAGDDVLRINDRITVSVWRVEITEPGDYELQLSEAPLGTQRLVVETERVELGGVALVLLSIPVFLGAVVLLVVSLLRSSGRRRRRMQAAYPQSPPAAAPSGYPQPVYPQIGLPPAPPPGWVQMPPPPAPWNPPPPPPGNAPPGPAPSSPPPPGPQG